MKDYSVPPLVAVGDVCSGRLAHLGAAEVRALEQVARWARTYLCDPHPDLGREGAVCPFTRASIDKGHFWLAIDTDDDLAGTDVQARVMAYRDMLEEMEPREPPMSRFKTILIVFPNITDVSRLDALQRALKSEFVEHGLMIGQFHPTCDEPGLWNDDFHPLRSPVPLLAIRHMVSSDFPFLVFDSRWVASYLERFAPEIPSRVRESITQRIVAPAAAVPPGRRTDDDAGPLPRAERARRG